jgi:hypothetical protein
VYYLPVTSDFITVGTSVLCTEKYDSKDPLVAFKDRYSCVYVTKQTKCTQRTAFGEQIASIPLNCHRSPFASMSTKGLTLKTMLMNLFWLIKNSRYPLTCRFIMASRSVSL